MTPQEITDHRMRWRPGHEVIIHSDLQYDATSWCKDNLKQWEWSMTKWTHVYAFTYQFEHEHHAEEFRLEFRDWVNKGID